MADLISRAAAIAEIEEYIEEYSELEPETGYHNLKWCAMEEAKDVLSMLPAVDAVPVVHGRWDIQISKHYADRWQADAFCSRCEFEKNGIWSGFFPDIQATQAREITRHYALKVKLPKYCENCGAKMDGERRESE